MFVLNCVHLTVELKVKMHKVEVRQHVCSANAKFALLFASFTKRFNGARLPYTELGYPHDTSMLYSEWVIIITNTVNIFTFLIQAPYNIDIYKRSMKMKPVRQIMYSVDVTVCFSLCERIPMDILVGGGWESDQTSQLVVVVFRKESTEKAKCGGEEGHQHNNDILYYFRFR